MDERLKGQVIKLQQWKHTDEDTSLGVVWKALKTNSVATGLSASVFQDSQKNRSMDVFVEDTVFHSGIFAV